MTLESMKQIIFSGGGILLILMTLIQITPIKFNPWSWIGRCIGRVINGEVLAKVDTLGKDLKNLRDECDEREANNCRYQILRFGDEILHGIPHSKEHYDNILIEINAYENYCADHPKYMNNVAVATISHIKKMYQKHLEEDSFL